MAGDELRLRYLGELHKPWSGMGHVTKTPTSAGEEVGKANSYRQTGWIGTVEVNRDT